MGIEKRNPTLQKHFFYCLCSYFCKTAARPEMSLFVLYRTCISLTWPVSVTFADGTPLPAPPRAGLRPRPPPHLRAPLPALRRAGARAPWGRTPAAQLRRDSSLLQNFPPKNPCTRTSPPSLPGEVLILVACLPFISRRVWILAAGRTCGWSQGDFRGNRPCSVLP